MVTFGPDAPALRDLGVTAEVRGSTGALQGYRGEAGHRVRVIPGNLTAQRAVAVHDTRRASALALGAVAITALALAAGRVAGSRGRQPTDAELPTAEPAADLNPVP